MNLLQKNRELLSNQLKVHGTYPNDLGEWGREKVHPAYAAGFVGAGDPNLMAHGGPNMINKGFIIPRPPQRRRIQTVQLGFTIDHTTVLPRVSDGSPTPHKPYGSTVQIETLTVP